MTATWADVERAVSGRSGRGPRNGRVWDGDVRARSRRWFNACVPDEEIPGLQRGLRRIGASEHRVLRPAATAGGAARESATHPSRVVGAAVPEDLPIAPAVLNTLVKPSDRQELARPGRAAKTIDDDGELGLGERVSSQGRSVETVMGTSRRRSCTVPGMPSFVSAPSSASRAAVSGGAALFGRAAQAVFWGGGRHKGS